MDEAVAAEQEISIGQRIAGEIALQETPLRVPVGGLVPCHQRLDDVETDVRVDGQLSLPEPAEVAAGRIDQRSNAQLLQQVH